MIAIAPAEARDIPQACAIYGHFVLNGLGTFEEVPPGIDEFRARHAAIAEKGLPYLVARQGDEVLGYAYAGPFRPRTGYRFSLEDSVYVRHDAHGRGIGRALLERLIPAATATGARQLMAVIGDSGNAGSIALHRAMGFGDAGRFRSVGFKFGRWVDVVLMQRALGPGDATLP